MSAKPTISFVNLDSALKGDVMALAEDGARMSEAVRQKLGGQLLDKAFRISEFKGGAMKSVEIIAPSTADLDRIVVVGAGKPKDRHAHDYMRLGGAAYAKAGKRDLTIILDMPSGVDAQQAASFAQGMLLRAYEFDRYKTKKDDDTSNAAAEVDSTVTDGTGAEARVDPRTDAEVDLRADVWTESGEPESVAADPAPRNIVLAVSDPEAAKAAFAVQSAIAEGVLLARDLVNEPANILGPVEFAERAGQLSALGVEIETLTEKEMTSLGMGALLGVSQGSIRPPRLVIMRWNGAASDAQPVAFIGKGVVFDTGGISIKPSLGMEDMKGDMAGAAAVTGLMHALAARKAKVNVIGIIGLVENMPDAAAQRPGDIVTSMSGQTIEIINTDAEGRLVLCDALWYCKERFKPRFMINLATLTGAILVALGNQHAGMFSNDNELAGRLAAAGETTQEKVWRMPLGEEYDKMIDSKFADMKNSAGRLAGSTTAAQFLKRFVGDVPWAHLDIAGTAMSSPQNEINRSWASGYGVRLLDELVRAHYED